MSFIAAERNERTYINNNNIVNYVNYSMYTCYYYQSSIIRATSISSLLGVCVYTLGHIHDFVGIFVLIRS